MTAPRSALPSVHRVALIAKPVAAVRAPLRRAFALLARAGAEIRLDAEAAQLLGRRGGLSREDAVRGADLVVCLGGDGTLLSAVRAIAGAPIPVLGVNAGSLGFLTETRREELPAMLRAALAGRLRAQPRLLLEVTVRRGRRALATYRCLNDLVITKGALARIITLAATVDGEPLTTYRADGLIIATPTGSTAYNLAVGGPLVDPASESLLIAPIAPHALSHRPLVLPASAILRILLLRAPGGLAHAPRGAGRGGKHDTVYLTADGQAGRPLLPGDSVEIRRASGALLLLTPPRRTWVRLLREKLHWGEPPAIRQAR